MSRPTMRLIALFPIAMTLMAPVAVAETTPTGVRSLRTALFFGLKAREDVLSPNFGADLEWRLPFADQAMAIGPIADLAFHDGVDATLALCVFFHPLLDGKLIVGPGLNLRQGVARAIFRTGLNYDFRFLERMSLGPNFYLDFPANEPMTFSFSVAVGLEI